MKFVFNLTDRKPLLNALNEITGEKPVYMRVPSCAYRYSFFKVTREGDIEMNDEVDRDIAENVIRGLAERGFSCADSGCVEAVSDARNETYADNPAGDSYEEATVPPITNLVVSVPRNADDTAAVDRLKNMIASKRTLLMKSLDIDDLTIEVDDHEIRFPWFKGPMSPDEGNAYIQLISAMWKMARDQKRIRPIEKPTDNDKYAFRCWLLRLGFIGDEYKSVRKILMRNLTGSAAFRYGRLADTIEG